MNAISLFPRNSQANERSRPNPKYPAAASFTARWSRPRAEKDVLSWMECVSRTPKQVREAPQGQGLEADAHSRQTGAPSWAAHGRGRARAHGRSRASSARKEKAGGGDSRAGERAPVAGAREQARPAPSGPTRASQQTASLAGGA